MAFYSPSATPKAVWASMENLYSVFARRLHFLSEKNFASIRILHPYERLVGVRINII